MTFQLIYTSEATDITWPWPEARIETLQNILEKARANNHTKGITGALVYVEGVFLQILEGNESDVKILAERISRDDRHAGFKVLLEKEVTERLFGAWDMACIRPSAKEMAGWASMDGTTTVTDIVNKLQKESGRLADLVTNIVKSHAGSGPAFRGEV